MLSRSDCGGCVSTINHTLNFFPRSQTYINGHRLDHTTGSKERIPVCCEQWLPLPPSDVSCPVSPEFADIADLFFPGLVRFVPRSDSSKILIGQPKDDSLDVGLALLRCQEVAVDVFSGTSVLSPGKETGQSAIIDRVLSPLAMSEVGTIRCIGLNVSQFLPLLQ